MTFEIHCNSKDCGEHVTVTAASKTMALRLLPPGWSGTAIRQSCPPCQDRIRRMYNVR